MRTLRLLRSFRRRTDGVAAIEAAFVLPVMFVLTFAAFDVANSFYKVAMVNGVTAEEARPIRTGNAFTADFVPVDTDASGCQTGRACFFDEVCETLSLFGDCDENLAVEVRRFDSFEDVAADDPVVCPNQPGYQARCSAYEPGAPNDIIRVRVCYTFKPFNPAYGLKLPVDENGKREVVAVSVFRNERYVEDDEDEDEDAEQPIDETVGCPGTA